jgi:hypothetical protein
VVKMDFDVEGAVMAQTGDAVQQAAVILFLRIEGGEAGRTARAVAWGLGGDARPTVMPDFHALMCAVERDLPVRLEVVRQRDPEAPGRALADAAEAAAEVAGQPEVCRFGERHESIGALLVGWNHCSGVEHVGRGPRR